MSPRRAPRGARRSVVALVALLLTGVFAPPHAHAQGTATTGRPVAKGVVTPVLSARRVPELLVSRLADEQVSKVVKDATKDQPPGSCVLVSEHGRTIVRQGADVPLLPASLAKTLTATVALKVLGPDTTLSTVVKGPKPGPDGVVDGDVYLVGGGDPLLYTAGFQQTREYRDQPFNDFNQLADKLKAAGVTQIKGNIVGDDTRYDNQRSVSTWNPSYQRDEQVGALSALQVNWGETGLSKDPNKTSKVRKLGDPPIEAAATLKSLLEQRGIQVGGQPVAGTLPASGAPPELATLPSMTVRQMVDEMLSFSDNNTAEMLTKELGFKTQGKGTTAAGVEVIMTELTKMGLPTAGAILVDGSGLDRNDRLTCDLVAALLDRAGPGSDLGRGMAVMGQKGTLKKRNKGSFIDGRVTAKTGTLKDVIALAGWEQTVPGTTLTFVSIQNGVSKPGVKVQDDILNGLLNYPQAPDLTALGPKPIS